MITIKSKKKRVLDKKKFHEDAYMWLVSEGWNILPETELERILFESHLENIPYKPHLLIEKDEIKFFICLFQKEIWAYSKKLMSEVTGFDLYKYEFLKGIQGKTGIQIGFVFTSESDDQKFNFRQMDMLPKPLIYFKNMRCLAHQYDRFDQECRCFKCWQLNPQTTRDCMHLKKKRREIVMWERKFFSDDTIIQQFLPL